MGKTFPTPLCWLQGYGTHYGALGRAFWDCARLIMGLGGGAKLGKGKDQGGSVRNKWKMMRGGMTGADHT